MLKLYDREFTSRLLIGSALYPSPAIMQGAIRASGARSQPSSPGLTGRSSTPRLIGSISASLEYWIPAFAGMTISVCGTRSAPPALSFRGARQREPGISRRNFEIPDRSAARTVRNDGENLPC